MAGKIYISRIQPTVPPVVTSDLRFEFIWPTVPQKIQWINVDHDQLGPLPPLSPHIWDNTQINQWGKSLLCRWLTISMNSPVFLSTAGVLESQDALASWVLAAHLRPDFSMENLLIKQGTVLGSNFHFSLRFRHVELCSWRDFGSFLGKMTWWHGCSASCRRWTKRKQENVEILDFQNQDGNIWELWLQGSLHVAWFV